MRRTFNWMSMWTNKTVGFDPWEADARATSHCLVGILGWPREWTILLRKWSWQSANGEWRMLLQCDNGVYVASIGWYGSGRHAVPAGWHNLPHCMQARESSSRVESQMVQYLIKNFSNCSKYSILLIDHWHQFVLWKTFYYILMIDTTNLNVQHFHVNSGGFVAKLMSSRKYLPVKILQNVVKDNGQICLTEH